MSTSDPFSHILSSVNEESAAIVVFAHNWSVDKVPLIESFTGKINFSSRFPPEIKQIQNQFIKLVNNTFPIEQSVFCSSFVSPNSKF